MKDGKVIKISGKEYAGSNPNECLVKLLKDVLEQVKTGELQSLYMTGLDKKGNIFSAFAGMESESENVYATLGAIDQLKEEYRKRKL